MYIFKDSVRRVVCGAYSECLIDLWASAKDLADVKSELFKL